MREVERNRVTKNNEQLDLKVENIRGSHPSSSGEKEEPSMFLEKRS
jgi:hypothetical protein